MPEAESSSSAFEKLRVLAVQDPKAARLFFAGLLDSNSPLLDDVLQQAGLPGEGRVRQLIANAVQSRPDKERLVPTLLKWLAHETDEFTKRGIEGALIGVDSDAHRASVLVGTIFDPAVINAYRYVASRLKHELRNALLDPRADLIRLRTRITTITDTALRAELGSIVGQLDDAFKRFGKAVDFEPTDEHFRFRNVDLYSWILLMHSEYTQRYSGISVSVDVEPGGGAVLVRANEYLLRIIFWNLWVNAHQAVPTNCKITIHGKVVINHAELLVVDNGGGFPASAKDLAFQMQYSGAANSFRGRGLLEIQDAVERLQGRVELIEFRPTEYRVRLWFPLVKS